MVKHRDTNKYSDTTFILKLILYVILGSQWLFLTDPSLTRQIPLPLGFGIGLLFSRHEHFQIDRKMEYIALILAMLIGYWAQTGIAIQILS